MGAETERRQMGDDEVVWEMLVLANSGRYRRLKHLLQGAAQQLPGVDPEQILRCAAQIGERMRHIEE